MRPLAAGLMLLVLGGPSLRAADADETARQAHELLKNYCHRCHGQDGRAEGGFNYVLDRDKLIERNKIVPGKPDKSKLYKEVDKGSMPKEDDNGTPLPAFPKEGKAVLAKWIEAGAPDFNPPAPKRTFITTDAVLKSIRDDLLAQKEFDRQFTRYFTLTHLHNAGLPDNQLDTYRLALSKLVNSLSWGRKIVKPSAIDTEKTVFRIDLRDYKWTDKTWDLITARNPYGVSYDTKPAKDCYGMAKTAQPFVRGDWFVSAAAVPPLYHDVLQIPKTDRELEKLLQVDVADNIRKRLVVRAGFGESGVSQNNRVIERHESDFTNGAYWKSYDFASNQGRQDLFRHPLDFQQDGGEIIFNLPNGLQAYMLVDRAGNRLDKGPTAIVKDPKRPDGAVVNGLSCMSCHDQGMKPKDDEVRPKVLANRDAYAEKESDEILGLFPEKKKLNEAYAEDAQRFAKAVERTGGRLDANGKIIGSDPVVTMALLFEQSLDLKLAAAEVGVPADVLLKEVDRSPRLAREVGELKSPGTIKRDKFVSVFGLIVSELKLGTFIAGGGKTLDLGGGVKLELVPIPSGTFQMGSDGTDKDAFDFEKPKHKVTIRNDFHLGKLEVTVGQFKRFVAEEKYVTEAEKANEKNTWKNPGFDQTDDHPVVLVSWNDARAFCAWLGKKAGEKVRLPREAEWEYACRAGSATRYYFGDDESKLGEFAWFFDNTEKGSGTRPCGTKKPNAFGLHDMHGNAWEWCEDGERKYRDQAETDPDGGPSASPGIRGGSFYFEARRCRSASRFSLHPLIRFDLIGFRVCVGR